MMTRDATQQLVRAWDSLQSLAPISVIRDEQQYDQAIETLDELLDIVTDDETHPLYELLDTLSALVEQYEETHYPAPDVRGVEVLKYLMQEHALAPIDLADIDDPAIISEILAGRRELNVNQIRALSKHFGISPATFF